MMEFIPKKRAFLLLASFIHVNGGSAALEAIPHATVRHDLTAPTILVPKTLDNVVTSMDILNQQIKPTSIISDVRPTYVVRGGSNLALDAACSMMIQSVKYSISSGSPSTEFPLPTPSTLFIALPGLDRPNSDWNSCINAYSVEKDSRVTEDDNEMAVDSDFIPSNIDAAPWGNGLAPFIVVHEFHPYPSRPEWDENNPEACSDGQRRLTSAVSQWLHDVSLSRDRMGEGRYDTARPTMTFEGALCVQPYIGFVDYMPGLGEQFRSLRSGNGKDAYTTPLWGQTAGLTNLIPSMSMIYTPSLASKETNTYGGNTSPYWTQQQSSYTWNGGETRPSPLVTTTFTSYVTVTASNSPNWGSFNPSVWSPISSAMSKPMSGPPAWQGSQPSKPPQMPSGWPSGWPTTMPPGWPTSMPKMPSGWPTAMPPGWPSGGPKMPSGWPTTMPPGWPNNMPKMPSGWPTAMPSGWPSGGPKMPSGWPTTMPPGWPTNMPKMPSGWPTNMPPGWPASMPKMPSGWPTTMPPGWPTNMPKMPSGWPTNMPGMPQMPQPSHNNQFHPPQQNHNQPRPGWPPGKPHRRA